ncbi:hypothetical protein FACS1894199_17070 [Bacteroidia bacterium]|nr:hypothetical protein FACS1894199_17070 [Bacteroidia bacterium]
MKDLKQFKQECERIRNEIEQIRVKADEEVGIDGVINSERYFKASPRVLWILKEPNGDVNDYAVAFANDQREETVHNKTTMPKIIWASYGILGTPTLSPFDDEEWSKMPSYQSEQCFDALSDIAFINIKKTHGGGSVSDDVIRELYNENCDLLKRQIKLYDPEVLIFGGTFKFFDKNDFEGWDKVQEYASEFLDNHSCYYAGDKLYIDTCHPAYWGVKDDDYVFDIVNAVRTWCRVVCPKK